MAPSGRAVAEEPPVPESEPRPGTEEVEAGATLGEERASEVVRPVPVAAPAAADTTVWHRKPVPTMFKSVLVPGWGQWSNGKHLKAGAFFLAEGYMIYRAGRAARNESDAEDLGLESEAERWNGERRDYTWWLLFAMVLSMGDAYVDAHLRGFDVEFESEGQGGRAAIRWTF